MDFRREGRMDPLTTLLSQLDENVLVAIENSASSQAEYLGTLDDSESRAMAGICGIIAIAAQAASLRRKTGVNF